MRHFLLILLTSLFVVIATGQPNIYPDTFPKVVGYKSVVVKTDYLCSNPATKNKVTSKYLFDNSGNTTAFLSICDNKICGRNIYTYSNNQLVSHKNFSTWTPYKNDISESKWDSTLLSNEITFQYNGNKLISYKDYVPEMQNVFFEKIFTYNSIGKIISENTKTYYDSITEKLETVHYAIIDKKEYAYNDTITNIKYYRNNTLRATEEMVTLKNGNIIRQTLKSVKGKILNKQSYKYNDKMQLVEINTVETGYDGFGNTYDSMAYEKTLLKYDDTGKLISKEQFYKGKLCNREKYEYSK
jgi:hypothetical protein